MVLSDKTIMRMLREGTLSMSPLEEGQIQPASVDIRLGNMFSIIEDLPRGVIDLENEINQDMMKLVELKKDIIRRIKAVESAELQTILELRYLSYMRWEEIAIELGYGIDNVFRLHRNALDEIEIPERIQ